MNSIFNFFKNAFTSRSHKRVCNSCSYYEDQIVDDQKAFAPYVTSEKGWISIYVQEKLLK